MKKNHHKKCFVHDQWSVICQWCQSVSWQVRVGLHKFIFVNIHWLSCSSTCDASLTFDMHLANIFYTCNFYKCTLRHIIPLLSLDPAESVSFSVVASSVGCCNSVQYSISNCILSTCLLEWSLMPRRSLIVSKLAHFIGYVSNNSRQD